VAILTTPLLISYFRHRSIGQHIREDGPASHVAKAGTPTMGGIAIVGAVVVGYALGHIGTQIRFSRTGYLAVGAVVAFGIIGFLDDWIKVSHKRSLGLNKRGKSGAQILCAVVFAELALHWAHTSTALSFTRSTIPGIDLGQVGWVVFAVVVMVGTSNAVNITDGVDGLAAGSGTFCFAVLSIMGYWIFRHVSIYHVLPASAIDLALVAVALAGACIGFLWWNAAPAKIIMGDTGSLSIGAGLAALCLLLTCCCPSSAACSSWRPCRSSRRSSASGPSTGASSAWRPSTTTSNWAAGPRRR
jgi:phospho-N-acetylmuramoyl-pentapeptide-transferase